MPWHPANYQVCEEAGKDPNEEKKKLEMTKITKLLQKVIKTAIIFKFKNVEKSINIIKRDMENIKMTQINFKK